MGQEFSVKAFHFPYLFTAVSILFEYMQVTNRLEVPICPAPHRKVGRAVGMYNNMTDNRINRGFPCASKLLRRLPASGLHRSHCT